MERIIKEIEDAQGIGIRILNNAFPKQQPAKCFFCKKKSYRAIVIYREEIEEKIIPLCWEHLDGAAHDAVVRRMMMSVEEIGERGDELITIGEAAEISGKSVSAISEQARKGKLTSYVDRTEPNPRRQTRLLKSQIMPKKKKKSPQ